MIQDAHGEHGIQGPQAGRHLLNAQRQQVHRPIAADEMPHRLELGQEQLRWVYTQGEGGAGPGHAPQVIAVAAADIEHAATVERRDMRRQAVPLPIRSPLAVDSNPIQFIRPLAPRVQRLQAPYYGDTGQRVGHTAYGDGGTIQVNRRCSRRRQSHDLGQPAIQIAMTIGGEHRVQLIRQLRGPVAERVLPQGGQQRRPIHHTRASSAAKLQHWNQTSTAA